MKKSMLITVFLVFAAVAGLYAGGSQETSAELKDDNKLQIVATTSIITDVVRNVAGDRAEVTGIIPTGQDPHGYEPNPRQIGAVEKADIVFVNGFDLEEQILAIIENTVKGGLVEVSAGVVPIGPEEDEHEADHEHEAEHDHEAEHEHDDDHDHDAEHEHHHEVDPHTWMSVRNVKIWVENIEGALSAADPENSEYYKSRAKEYTAKLETLDREISEDFKSIPEEKRLIVTDHMLFGYFARDYGFSVVGTILPSLSTNSEASAKHLGDLVELIKNKEVNAILVGASSSEAVNKLAKTLSEESGRDVEIISILTGSLAPEGRQGDTYLGFFRYNVEQIVKGLKTD